MRLVFIGAGKMATAMARGLVENGVWAAADLVGVDPVAGAREAFARGTGAAAVESPAAVLAGADVVVLAVKPQVAPQLLPGLGAGCGGKLVISIVAGLPLAKLSAWFPGARVVRTMPNTPLTVGKGATAFACAAGVTAADREVVRRIFGALGIVLEMPEGRINAVTALSGSGPAYVFELIQALTDAGVAVGLSPEAALELTVQTVAGAAEMVRRKLGTPDELRVAVTSPGGTTAAGLAVLSRASFRPLMAEVVRAARDRAIELGS